MASRRLLFAALFALFTAAPASAESWKQEVTFFWPETVQVHFADNDHHQWTPKEKRRALRAMDGYLWSRTKKPSTLLRRLFWLEEVCDGKRWAVIERPAKLIESGTAEVALVIVQVQPLHGAGQTTLPTAGFPVKTTIAPGSFPDYVWILDHEARHLGGATHSGQCRLPTAA